MAWFSRSFLSIDPRTLGLTRILLGLLLLFDLAKRVPGIPFWYTNDGLLPQHRLLWRPLREWGISLLYGFTSDAEVGFAFALIALAYLALLVGWKTRVAHVLSWVGLISVQMRVDLLATGGDYVLGILLLWTMFLPMGARFSIDAVLAERRARGASETAPGQPAAGGPAPDAPIVSLAVLALLLQLAVIYLFNGVHKDGVTWRDGSAIYWVLHQARIVTHFGLWAREHVPLVVLRALTHATVAIELALPLLILSPWGRPWTRRAAIVLIFGLHAGAQLVMNLGVFTPVMIVFSALLVTAEDWRALARWRLARSLSALRARVKQIARALWGASPAEPEPGPLGLRLRRGAAIARELAVAALMVVASWQVLVENHALARLGVTQPRAVRAAVSYLRLNQGWGMFAPDAPRSDLSLVVDARTVGGRRVDPYNSVASDVADPALRVVPPRLGHDAFWCDYTTRILDHPHLQDRLARFIRDHHLRTGRPEDRIASYTVHVVEQDSPPPGETGPRNVRVRRLMGYRDAR